MTKLIIIRHGYSQGNKEKRFSGQLDVPLDAVGLSQAASTAEYVVKNFRVDRIYSSDLCRAFDTVKPIADALGLPVIKTRQLREVDVGHWQGRLIQDVEKEYPESFALYKETPGLARFDGGESFAQLVDRTTKAMEAIAAENEGKTVVVGTHGGVIRVLRAAWTNTPLADMKQIPHVPNGSITIAQYEAGRFSLSSIGSTEHLADKTTEAGVK